MALEISSCEGGGIQDPGKFAGLFGPGQVDQGIRQAIQICWMMLPTERRNVDNLEREVRRIVDRALKELRDDAEAFGCGKE